MRGFVISFVFYGFLMVTSFHVSVLGYVLSLEASVTVIICARAEKFPRLVPDCSGRRRCVRACRILFIYLWFVLAR